MQCKIVTSGIIHKVVGHRVTFVSMFLLFLDLLSPAKPMAISNLILRCRVKATL